MKIDAIHLSIFELPSNTGQFDLVEEVHGTTSRWRRQGRGQATGELHVLHIHTDAGVQGVCTVGDARYTTTIRSYITSGLDKVWKTLYN